LTFGNQMNSSDENQSLREDLALDDEINQLIFIARDQAGELEGQAALATIREATRRAKLIKDGTTRFDAIVSIAWGLSAIGKSEMAVDAFRELFAIINSPDADEQYRWFNMDHLARAAAMAGSFQIALEAARAISHVDERGEALAAVSFYQASQKEFAAAGETIESIEAPIPYALALADYGEMLSLTESARADEGRRAIEEAFEVASEFCENEPEVKIRCQLARAYISDGRLGDSVQLLQEALTDCLWYEFDLIRQCAPDICETIRQAASSHDFKDVFLRRGGLTPEGIYAILEKLRNATESSSDASKGTEREENTNFVEILNQIQKLDESNARDALVNRLASAAIERGALAAISGDSSEADRLIVTVTSIGKLHSAGWLGCYDDDNPISVTLGKILSRLSIFRSLRLAANLVENEQDRQRTIDRIVKLETAVGLSQSEHESHTENPLPPPV
jgi:hypothetical protein